MLLANSKRQWHMVKTLDLFSKIRVQVQGVLVTRGVLWEGLTSGGSGWKWVGCWATLRLMADGGEGKG